MQTPHFHDFATVRIFEIGAFLEVHFAWNDDATKTAVKKLSGRYDKGRKAWRVDSTRRGKERCVADIRDAILAGVPDLWRKKLPQLERISCVTTNHSIVIGAGGVRLSFPRGHKHEYTLKNDIARAQELGFEWIMPASICGEALPKTVIADMLIGDRNQFLNSVGILEGFALSGRLNVGETDPLLFHLAEGNVVYITTEFLAEVDDKLEPEPLKVFPMAVVRAGGEVGAIDVVLRFMTGNQGYGAAERFARTTGIPVVDTMHVDGRWKRHRASSPVGT